MPNVESNLKISQFENLKIIGYYPCFACHGEAVGHAAEVWKVSGRYKKAIL